MLAILFWVILIVAIVFGFAPPPYKTYTWVPWVVLFIIVGLRVFGSPLHS